MLQRRILVIDDEPSVAKLLRLSLELQNFSVRTEGTGAAGIQAAIEFRPELVVLDLGLPDIDGFEVLNRLREWSRVPILVLTVQDSDEDKVRALDGGADDFVTKPFSVPELLARVRVALRHGHPTGAAGAPVVNVGPLEIDFAGHLVKMEGREIRLTATEYDLLSVLVKNAGKVVTHRVLLKEIWGPNATEHTQYLRVYMGQIRKKLKAAPGAPEIIVTEPGVGYRLLTGG
ncbi:MAG: response regulator transcription factor [Proteobacteria bacterium]|nr:MAG: response regulator transcription factor [Pseudomonadota bacterium]